ncbi:hypothetical protein XENOCAPTIV_020257 [Xenoophorus captivus]|uniref:Uncharacterized protein n=1 Tax=Xenoophorus captivus TaxID=1517983 RepID=A0ABV0S533_9TELE
MSKEGVCVWRNGPKGKEIPEFSHSHPPDTHPAVSIPKFVLLFFASQNSLSEPHPITYAHLHTSKQLGEIQSLLSFPEPFQSAAEPLGHRCTAQCLHTLPY